MRVDGRMPVLAVILYNLVLVAGTAYLVEERNWSMWTFLLTALFFISSGVRSENI